MTRGEYVTDWSKSIWPPTMTKIPGWASSNAATGKRSPEQPSFAGGFIWTGFDYRGEPHRPTDGRRRVPPSAAMDLCGFPKTAVLHPPGALGERQTRADLVPHWNWPGKEGQPIKVMALTNADTVALSLNGKLIEEKPVDPFEMVEWQVPYAPGRLEAVAKNGGKEVARYSVETTGEPVALRLTPDRKTLAGDGYDALPVTVEALDKRGTPVPTANLRGRI